MYEEKWKSFTKTIAKSKICVYNTRCKRFTTM